MIVPLCKILGYKQKVNLIGIDLERACRESEMFLSRVKKAWKNDEASVSTLRSTQQKYKNASSCLTTERKEVKYHSKREITRIRNESNNETVSSRAY